MDFRDSAARKHLRSLVGGSGALLRGRITRFGQGVGPVADFFVIRVNSKDTVIARSLCPVHQDGDWLSVPELFAIDGKINSEFSGLEVDAVKEFRNLERIQLVFCSNDAAQRFPAGVLRIALDGMQFYLVLDEPFSMVFFSSPEDLAIRDDTDLATGQLLVDV